MKVIKYCITVKDIMRDSVFTLEYDTDTELKISYDNYKKDSDYEVISMESVLLEIRPIDLHTFDNVIM